MQGVGFAGEVGGGDVDRIVAAARRRCVKLAPLTLTLGPAVLLEEGVWLRVAPPAAVRRVRAAVRAGIADVWDPARVPEPADDFTPHVSLAYSNTDEPSEPYAAALAEAGLRSATMEVAAIQAISLSRDTHLYRWETIATVPLGTGAIRGNRAEPVRSN